jgi:hypothetical protein
MAFNLVNSKILTGYYNLLRVSSATRNEYEKKNVPIEIEYRGYVYTGEGTPISSSCGEGVCFELDITLNHIHIGVIHYTANGWRIHGARDQELVDSIGRQIFLWYE